MSDNPTAKPDGGPAFPFEYHNQTSRHQESFVNGRKPIAPDGSEQYGGMTLRDWFAGKAMQGDWSSQSTEEGFFSEHSTELHLAAAAKLYYRMADAMLAEREKR